MEPYRIVVKQSVSKKPAANLLWTGGWDSTFQLLQLLLVQRRQVTPFYLIDAERPSTGVELQTMKRIKERILKNYPHTRELLQPTRFFAAGDVAPNAEITAAFEAARRANPLGIQYDWLARFCKQHDITDMQMGIQRDGRIYRILKEYISEDADGYYVKPEHETTSEYVLFHWFNFPIINRTKLQMADYAKEHGWETIMNMTWFCFTPKRDGTPCGKCNPCRYAIEEGLGWRIPERNQKPASRRTRIVRALKRALRHLNP